MNARMLAFLIATAGGFPVAGAPFEGRIEAIAARGGKAETLRYAIGPVTLRIEVAGEGKVEPVNLVDLKTGALTVFIRP